MKKHLHPIILIFILSVALIARFRYLTAIEHNVDHAYPIWQALTTLERFQWPLAGQGTSVLFANPPLTGYLYLPVVALTRSMLGVYLFVIALNTLGVYFTYRAVLAVTRPAPALIAAALVAVNPWIIEYSRTTWVQSLLPFFMPAIAALLWPVLLNKARRPAKQTLLAFVLIALFTHTYLLAFFILAPLGALLVIFRKRIVWRSVAAGMAVFALLFSLYAIGLLGQADTVGKRVESFTETKAHLNADALQAALRLVTGEGYDTGRGLSAPTQDATTRHALSLPFQQVLSALVLIGALLALIDIIRKTPRRDPAVIVLLWFALPVLAMSYTGNPVHPFYQFLSVPAGVALAMWGLDSLRGQWRGGALALAGILLVPFGLLMLTNHARYSQETIATPGAFGGFYALPIAQALEVGQAINADLPEGGRVYMQAEEWIANSFAGTLFSASQDVRVPNFVNIPAQGGLILTLSQDPPPVPAGAERRQQIMLIDGNIITIDRLPRADEMPLIGEMLDVPSMQGLRFLSADLRQDGDHVTLTTVWRVDALPDANTVTWILQPFLHVMDANGERILNLSGEGFPTDAWQVGDLHLYQTIFALPADAAYPLTVQTGQFDGTQGTALTFILPSGEYTQAITLPMVIEAP